MYFDAIVVHPIKVTLSFVNTSALSPEDGGLFENFGGTALQFIKNFSTVDRAPIRCSAHCELYFMNKINVLCMVHSHTITLLEHSPSYGSTSAFNAQHVLERPSTLLMLAILHNKVFGEENVTHANCTLMILSK
jgi:hypothetical protein